MDTQPAWEEVRPVKKTQEAQMEYKETTSQPQPPESILKAVPKEESDFSSTSPAEPLTQPCISIHHAPSILRHPQLYQNLATGKWTQEVTDLGLSVSVPENQVGREQERVLVVSEYPDDQICHILTHTRCKTRKTCRERASSSSLSDAAPKVKPHSSSPLHSYHTAEHQISSGSVKIIDEDVGGQISPKKERLSANIGIALTTTGDEAEPALGRDNMPERIAQSDDEKCAVEPSLPLRLSLSDVQPHRQTWEDLEAGLTALPRTSPKFSTRTPKQRTHNSRRHFWHILIWCIAWLSLVAALCTVIGQDHTRLSEPSLLGQEKSRKGQKLKATQQQHRVRQHHIFSHIQLHRYTLSWLPENLPIPTQDVARRDTPTQDTWDVTLGARTLSNNESFIVELKVTSNHSLDIPSLCAPLEIEINPSQHMPESRTFSHIQYHRYTLPWTTIMQQDQKRAAHTNASDTWTVELGAKTVSNTAIALIVDMQVTSKHTVDLQSLCGRMEILPPSTEESPALPATPTTQHRAQRVARDSKAIVFVKNLLSCLWFLPIWLLSQWVVKRVHVPWLAKGEDGARMRIAGVVVSLLAAAAVGLGIEIAIRRVAEGRTR
jgi:hypothetical protein